MGGGVSSVLSNPNPGNHNAIEERGASLDGISYQFLGGNVQKLSFAEDILKKVDIFVKEMSFPDESVGLLSKALTNPFSDLGEFASICMYRAIFVWIASNIAYDIDGLKAGNTDSTPDGVLSSRRGLCFGYSSLFIALCEGAGLTAQAVRGWAKGYAYQVGDRFEENNTNHEWNTIIIDNEEYLVDSCWAAGFVKDDLFVRKFNNHFWMTSPGQFIFDHLPVNPSKQFLSPVVTLELFNSLVFTQSGFFNSNLSIISHPYALVECGEEVKIEIGAASETNVLATLLNIDEPSLDYSRFVLIQRNASNHVASVLAHPPAPGLNYILRIFTNLSADNSDEFDWAADYRLQVTFTGEVLPLPAFPHTFNLLSSVGYALYSPLEGVLCTQCSYLFSVYAAGATHVSVILPEGQCIQLVASEDKQGIYEKDIGVVSCGELSLVVQAASSEEGVVDTLAQFVCKEENHHPEAEEQEDEEEEQEHEEV